MAQEVTQLFRAVERGDPQAAERLLPLVYDELRRLAACKMQRESLDHTLQATALVHEAYLRLVGSNGDRQWDSRRHFFAAAAEAMRRILIEEARRKHCLKYGGGLVRQPLNDDHLMVEPGEPVSLLALDAALTKLRTVEPDLVRLVELRFFTGLTVEEAAEALDISPRTAKRNWSYARAWLRREMEHA
jgi:RNA polymerase sigma factor (TIGR02999 family)